MQPLATMACLADAIRKYSAQISEGVSADVHFLKLNFSIVYTYALYL